MALIVFVSCRCGDWLQEASMKAIVDKMPNSCFLVPQGFGPGASDGGTFLRGGFGACEASEQAVSHWKDILRKGPHLTNILETLSIAEREALRLPALF